MPNPNATVAGGGHKTVPLGDFGKGENRKQSDHATGENVQPISLKNWYLAPDGSLLGRRGTLRWNASSLGAARTRGSTRAYPTNGNTPHFLAYQGTRVAVGTDSTKTFADTTRTGLSATALMTFTQWLSHVYAPNGVDAHQKWNADTQAWSTWGIAAPTAGATANLSATAASALLGKYQFKYTNVLASGAESNASAASGVVEVLAPVDPTDDFNRANNASLGLNWTESEFDTVNMQIVSNGIRVRPIFVDHSAVAFYSGVAFKSDHSCSLTFIAIIGTAENDRIFGISVRSSGTRTSFTGYGMMFERRIAPDLDDRWLLVKYVNSDTGVTPATNRTVLATQPGNNPLVANDVIKIRATGSLIEGLVNNVVVVSATDAAITAAGSPGVLFERVVATASLELDWDNFVMTGAAAKQIDLSAILAGPAGTTKRKVYGFKDAVSSVYNLVATISDNTTTTYSVTTDQGSWTTEVSVDQDVPPAKAWISALHKNRAWLAADSDNPTRLYFSKARATAAGAEAEAFPTNNFLDIALDTGDKITALYPFGDVLLVFGNESVFYVTGDDEFSFFPKRSNATSGCPGPWAVDRVVIPGLPDSVIFLSRNGVMVMSGTDSVLVSEPEEPLFSDVPDQASTLNYAEADEATVKFYDRLKAVLISFPVGTSVTNNFSLWYFVGRGFVEDTRSFKQVLALGTHDTDGSLYGWDANAGILRQVDTLFTDDGAAVAASVEFPHVKGDPREIREASRWWQFVSFVTGSTVAATVTASVDDAGESESFSMQTNRDERFSSKMVGRRLKLSASFALSVAFRLSEVVLRYLTRGQLRQR